jgi:hypothetical protein
LLDQRSVTVSGKAIAPAIERVPEATVTRTTWRQNCVENPSITLGYVKLIFAEPTFAAFGVIGQQEFGALQGVVHTTLRQQVGDDIVDHSDCIGRWPRARGSGGINQNRKD